jgi:hypothetical protein
MKFTKRHQKFVLALVAIVVFAAMAVAEVIDGNAALVGIAGVLAGMGVSDGVNLRRQ